MVNLNDFKQIQKHRIKGTHESIRLKLDNIDEEQIRTELFVKTDNEYAKGLLEKIEGQMLWLTRILRNLEIHCIRS